MTSNPTGNVSSLSPVEIQNLKSNSGKGNILFLIAMALMDLGDSNQSELQTLSIGISKLYQERQDLAKQQASLTQVVSISGTHVENPQISELQAMQQQLQSDAQELTSDVNSFNQTMTGLQQTAMQLISSELSTGLAIAKNG